MTTKLSLDAQIEEVLYEISQRKSVYPRLVQQRKLRESVGELHIARMEAVLATLRWLQQHEAFIRASIQNRQPVDTALETQKDPPC